MRFLLFACFTSFLGAQVPTAWEIKATPPNPTAGQTVVLEVVGLSPSPSLSIDWDNKKGDGVWVTKSGKQGQFTPTKAGDVVIIVCTLSGGLKKEIPYELKVAGETAAPPPNAQPAPPAPHPVPPQSPPPRQSERLPPPPEAVPLGSIVATNEAFVTATGWMGDALAAGVVSLAGAQACKFDVECLSLVYDVPHRKEGFVAFAWQVVPQGQKWNWGEYKGVDLSGRGFKSLRVFAKADPAFPVLPKVEFKTGGNIDPKFAAMHSASYLVSTGVQPLSAEWREFCLDVSHSNLKDVVSPLTVVVSSLFNPVATLGLFIDGAHFSKLPCGQ